MKPPPALLELKAEYAAHGLSTDFTTEGYHDRVSQMRLLDLESEGTRGPLAEFRARLRGYGYRPEPYVPAGDKGARHGG